MVKNKSGQGMSTSTIVLLILGLIILVVLILGFTMGWNKILPFISTNNLDTLQGSCQAACSLNNKYDFCTFQRSVNDGVNKKFQATCLELSTNQEYVARNYGIAQCEGLCESQ